ncbi:zonadhesin-like [Zerene cesonia]|uniref:zonadhesin-like n=1 Tax=Zerene cesonia TaxID=33412 RepID=UPI0018E56123|nr:zonadhesin-like [Zerene cesonia]
MLKLTLILTIVGYLVIVTGSDNCSGRNEYYEKCANTCSPQTCDSIGKVYHCPRIKIDCVGMCKCIDGFYRNAAGECISEEQCYNQLNADSSTSQDTLKYPPVPTSTINSSSDSQDFSSSSEDDDVTSSASSSEEGGNLQTNPKCGLNEVFDLCPAPCPPKRCDVDERVIRCKSPPKLGDKECVPSCRCADNYYRNNEGLCVLKSQCPKCLGKDEVYEECPRTCPPQTCESIWSKVSCPVRPAVCMPSCRCKPDMYRNKLGECISREDCPECKENEVYVKNIKAIARPSTCSESILGLMEYEKESSRKPTPGCVCAEGYARNHEGRCIPTEDCYADVGVTNFDTIDTNQTEVIVITAVAYLIPSSVCGPHEVWSDCIIPGCDNLNCLDLIPPKNCLPLAGKCQKGCRCRNNYLRDKNGVCIPIADCPAPKCPGRDEVYELCPKTCPPQTCRGLQAMYKCSANVTNCEPSCRCKPNMYRNELGQCITRQQCSQCKDNEMYIRNMNEWHRPKSCADLNNPQRFFSTQLNTNMSERPGCVCVSNYVRNDEGTCIPIKQCPPQCGRNEIYVNNTRAVCQPTRCSQLGYPLECELLEDSSSSEAHPGCMCKEDYVRDDNGECIAAEKCPSCGGDPNATKGCGVYCNTCDTLRNGPRPCPRICVRNGCNCKKNYIFDATQSKCVLPENCGNEYSSATSTYNSYVSSEQNSFAYQEQDGTETPSNPEPICGPDEVPDGCINGGCGRQNCSQLAEPQLCIDLIEGYCKKGCRCKENYLRDANGICVPITQCPIPDCGQNEVFDFCPAYCLPDCDVDESLILCKESPKLGDSDCNPGCRCADNLYRTRDGSCVPKTECPKCGQNEQYVSDINEMCRAETCAELGSNLECFGEGYTISSQPGCICVQGYVKNDDGICIPEENCPSCGGDANATVGCGSFCTTCSNYKQQDQIACIQSCRLNGCACRTNYVYNEDIKRCVLPQDCPSSQT